jgi:hypothetical protein
MFHDTTRTSLILAYQESRARARNTISCDQGWDDGTDTLAGPSRGAGQHVNVMIRADAAPPQISEGEGVGRSRL